MIMEMVLGQITSAQTPVKDVPSKITSSAVVTKPLFEENKEEKPFPPPLAQVMPPPPPPQPTLEVPPTMEEPPAAVVKESAVTVAEPAKVCKYETVVTNSTADSLVA